MAWAQVDMPVTDLDVFGRYVLGTRRFSAGHLDAVRRYLAESWGPELNQIEPSRFLERFAFLAQRRSRCRFVRYVPARREPRGSPTWRATPAGLVVVGETPTPADIARWRELPAAGWEPLLVLWAAAGRNPAHVAARMGALRPFASGYDDQVRSRLGRRAPTSRDIVSVVSTFDPSLSPLAMRPERGRGLTVASQLRWLRYHGLVASRPRARRVVTEPFGFVGDWGWLWLRRAMEPHVAARLSCGPLLAQIVGSATRKRIWSPKLPDDSNEGLLAAYQRTQTLIDNTLVAFPGRWRGCAQEFALTNVAFFADDHLSAPRLPVPAGSDMAGARRSWRRIDGVLWQAGDRWDLPSVLLEYENGARPRAVKDHLVTALHVASQSRRPTVVVFITTTRSKASVERTLRRELSGQPVGRGHYWPGAHLQVRVVTWHAARAADVLSCPALLDEHYDIPDR